MKFILVGIGLVVGDLCMKNWADHGYSLQNAGLLLFLAALLAYSVSLTYYGLQLKTTNFSVATILPILINILLVLFITIFYYHQPLSIKQFIGVLLGIGAVILLN